MANFCTSCGAAVNPGAPFCTQCGSRVSSSAEPLPQAAAVPPPVPPSPAPLAPASSSPLLKILLAAILGLFILGALGLAGVYYVAHRAKDRIERVARDYGADSSEPRGPSAHRVEVCSLLTKEEAAEIMGVPVERVEPAGTHECRYFGQAPTDEEREKAIEDARRKLEESKGDPDMKAAENMTKNMLGGLANGAGPSFSVKVDWEGGHAAMKAMRLTMGVITGNGKIAESLRGVGDEAVLGPMNSILVCAKGDTAVTVDLRMLPNGRERGIDIAKRVISRLEY